jgi:hypothetical protein
MTGPSPADLEQVAAVPQGGFVMSKLLTVLAAVALSTIGCDLECSRPTPAQVPVLLILGAVFIAGRLAVSLYARRRAAKGESK